MTESSLFFSCRSHSNYIGNYTFARTPIGHAQSAHQQWGSMPLCGSRRTAEQDYYALAKVVVIQVV